MMSSINGLSVLPHNENSISINNEIKDQQENKLNLAAELSNNNQSCKLTEANTFEGSLNPKHDSSCALIQHKEGVKTIEEKNSNDDLKPTSINVENYENHSNPEVKSTEPNSLNSSQNSKESLAKNALHSGDTLSSENAESKRLTDLYNEFIAGFTNPKDDENNQGDEALFQGCSIMNSQKKARKYIPRRRETKSKAILEDEMSTPLIANEDVAQKAKMRLMEWMKLNQETNAEDHAKQLLSIVFCKNNCKSKLLTKNSTPLYNFTILKYDFDVCLSEMNFRVKERLKSLISKLNDVTKGILREKAELICKNNGLNISKILVAIKTESKYLNLKSKHLQKKLNSPIKLAKLSKKLFSKYNKYCFTGDKSFELKDGVEGSYFVPSLSSQIIEFDPQYEFLVDIALTFGYNLEFRKQYDLYDYKFKLMKQSFRRSDNLKSFISYRQNTNLGLEKEIKERKDIEDSNYLNLCSQSVSYFVNDLIKKTKSKKNHDLNKEFGTLSIQNFSWSNDRLISKLIDDHLEGSTIIEGTKLQCESEWSESSMTYTQCFCAEFLFGSYTQLINYDIKEIKEKNLIKALIIKRHNAIVDYVKNFQIDSEADKCFSNTRWNYILQEIVDYEAIAKTTKEANIEKEFILQEEKAKEDGFDAISGIESCYGMLKVLYFRKYFCSMKTFLNQKSFKGIIGQGIWKDNIFKNSEDQNEQHIDSRMIENKISLYRRIQIKIEKLFAQLSPVLKWRFLSESILEYSKKKKRYENNLVSTEELAKYKIFTVYMYMLAILKQPNYFPDISLRIKVYCLNHLKLKETTEDYEVCSCCYGLDEPTLTMIVNGKINKEDIVSIHLNECFVKDEQEEKYTVKAELKEKLKEKIKRCPGLLGGMVEYEKYHRLKIVI